MTHLFKGRGRRTASAAAALALSSALSKFSCAILLCALGPRDELAEGLPCGLICSTCAWKRQPDAFCWPALRDFIKNTKKKARCRSRSARCLSLSLSATWMLENLLLFIAHFLKCTLIAHYISSLGMKVTPPPSSMPMSGARPVEARLTCWLGVSECVFFFLNQEFSVRIAVAMKRGEWNLKKQTNKQTAIYTNKCIAFLATSAGYQG